MATFAFKALKSSHKRHTVKSASNLTWISKQYNHFNAQYSQLSSLIRSKSRKKSKYHAQMQILRQMKEHTFLNVQDQLFQTQLFKPSITKHKKFKTMMNELPIVMFDVPFFDNFKKEKYSTYMTFKSFPDNKPIEHWYNFISFLSQYNYQNIAKYQQNRENMIALFQKQLKSAQQSLNIEAQLLIKQIAEQLFDAKVINNELKVMKVSQYRIDEYEEAKKELISHQEALNKSIEEYNKRIEKLQNEYTEIITDTYIDEYEENTSLSMYLRANHLSTKIEQLTENRDDILKRASQYKQRRGKNAMKARANRLKSGFGLKSKVVEECQIFASLRIDSSNREVVADVARATDANIVEKDANIVKSLLLSQNIYSEMKRNNPNITPVEALKTWEDFTRKQKKEFIVNNQFKDGVTSVAIMDLYCQDGNKNKNVPKASIGAVRFGKLKKNQNGIRHLNASTTKETIDNLSLHHLTQPEEQQCLWITHYDDDSSVMRGGHATTNNCRNNSFLCALTDKNGEKIGVFDDKMVGYKTSSHKKDKTYLHTQNSVVEVTLGVAKFDENGNVLDFKRRGNGQVHLIVVSPKCFHSGSNADAKSILCHVFTMDCGASDVYLLNWNVPNPFPSGCNVPKQTRKDILLYYTFIRLSDFLFEFTLPAAAILSGLTSKTDRKKNKSGVAMVLFILQFLCKNSLVMGNCIQLLTNTLHFQPLLLQMASLTSIALDALFQFNIEKHDLYVFGFLSVITFDTTFDKLISFESDKVDMIQTSLESMQNIVKCIIDIEPMYESVKWREKENDLHDGGQVGNEKKMKRATDVLYCIATKKTEFHSGQCAGGRSRGMASEQVHGGMNNAARRPLPHSNSYSIVNIGPKERFKITKKERAQLFDDAKRKDMIERCKDIVQRANRQKCMNSPLYVGIFPHLENIKEHFTMLFPDLLVYIIHDSIYTAKKNSLYPTEMYSSIKTTEMYSSIKTTETQHCLTNYKIKTTYIKGGCFSIGKGCNLNCAPPTKPLSIAPSPIPIERENNYEFMQFVPFNAKNNITKDNLKNYDKVNPFKDFNLLYKQNQEYSYFNDKTIVKDLHPEKDIGKISFSSQTNNIIETFLHHNPSQRKATYSAWLKKLQSPLTENAVLKLVHEKIDEMIEDNIATYVKHFRLLDDLNYDIKSTDEDILSQIQENKLRSILTEILDEEPIACLSVVIPRIVGKIKNEYDVLSDDDMSSSEESDNDIPSSQESDDNAYSEYETNSEYETSSESESD
eukprot:320704_1